MRWLIGWTHFKCGSRARDARSVSHARAGTRRVDAKVRLGWSAYIRRRLASRIVRDVDRSSCRAQGDAGYALISLVDGLAVLRAGMSRSACASSPPSRRKTCAKSALPPRRSRPTGYTGVSTQENRHDPFLALAVAGVATKKIELHTGVAISFPRSPMVAANVGWDIAAEHGRAVHAGPGLADPRRTTRSASPCRGRRPRRACASTSRRCARSGRRGRATASSPTRASTIASP